MLSASSPWLLLLFKLTLYSEMGIQPSALSVAQQYAGLLSGFVIDDQDADLQVQINALGMATLVTNTLMKTRLDRKQLAGEVLEFAGSFGIE